MPTEIIKYKCDFCKSTFNKKNICEKHELKCKHNSNVKCCGNCKYSEKLIYQNRFRCSKIEELKSDNCLLIEYMRVMGNFEYITKINYNCKYHDKK